MSSNSPTERKVIHSIDGIIPRQSPIVHREVATHKIWNTHRRLLAWGGIGIVAAALIIAGIVILANGNNPPIPTTISKAVGFPLYYPSSMPKGYTYQTGSAKLEHGLVFYTLQNGISKIIVSEQAAPANPPALTQLTGFTSLKTLAGNAAIGTTSTKQPLVIIISNTTLITMTGDRGLPSDVVAILAQNMSSLPQE